MLVKMLVVLLLIVCAFFIYISKFRLTSTTREVVPGGGGEVHVCDISEEPASNDGVLNLLVWIFVYWSWQLCLKVTRVPAGRPPPGLAP